jgi:drug/metabolite transporter (DMT)-like permease
MGSPVTPVGKRFRPSPSAMLVAVTALWGLSFPLTKDWQEAARRGGASASASSFTLIALRMALALALLAVARPRLFTRPTRREHWRGLAIGVVFFTGFGLQTLGIAWTTPALSAFITSLASAWVPVLAWFLFGLAPPGLTALGLAVGVGGTAVLSLAGLGDAAFGRGEVLTLLGALVFGFEILLLDRFGRTINPAHLTPAFLGTAGVLAAVSAAVAAAAGPGVATWLAQTREMLADPPVLRALGLLAGLSVLTFHWMNVYQPQVAATRAALIYLLEPIFGTLFSIAWGHDRPTWHLFAGGGLILAGNLLAEWPRWRNHATGGRCEARR